MFANLKNKLIEEVKASPSKFQQFANAAQAAVSSSSSTTPSSTDSSSNNATAASENFFSITEEDTPQNSPFKPNKLPLGASLRGRASTQSLNNGGGGGAVSRTRKLSNSSMASDVSFRLPAYDAPAVYHLQSDFDASGSELEDAASATACPDVISKDQLYDAYKKSLDRYHKYRCRYTDLAKKYKDLEYDSSKARAVLVETQDKAIRRISELREQCALEQQAKAHLEEALRMEMDDMSCKMQAYATKLQLLGENPAIVANKTSGEAKQEAGDSLIDLSELANALPVPVPSQAANGVQQVATANEELQVKITELMAELSARDNQLVELQTQHAAIKSTIATLRKQEEENVLLIAQTKQSIHTELEDKENEVKQLKENLKKMENNLEAAVKKDAELSQQYKEEMKRLQSAKQEADAKVISTEHLINTLKGDYAAKEQQCAALEAQCKATKTECEQSLQDLQQQNAQLSEMVQRYQQQEVSLAEVDNELNHTKNEYDNLNATLTETIERLSAVENALNQSKNENDMLKAKLAGNAEELNDLSGCLEAEREAQSLKIEEQKAKYAALSASFEESAAHVKEVERELQLLKEQCVNTESESVRTYRAELSKVTEAQKIALGEVKANLEQKEKELKTATNKLNKQKKQHEQQQSRLSALNAEHDKLKLDLAQQAAELAKAKDIENEKQALQERVASILQEMGSMQAQLEEVVQSHANLVADKRSLQSKIDALVKQQKDDNIDVDHLTDAWQESEQRAKLAEDKLGHIQWEQAELTERCCQLEEKTIRLEKQQAERRRQQETEEANVSFMQLKLQTEKDEREKLNQKMKQVLDENSFMHNAHELMDHDYRTLQDKNDALEKEKLIAQDALVCARIELQSNIEARQALQDEVQALKSTAQEAVSGLAQLQDELNALKAAQAGDERHKALLATAQKCNEQLQQELDKITEQLQAYAQDALTLEQAREDLALLRGERENLHDEIAARRNDNDELQAKLQALEDTVQAASLLSSDLAAKQALLAERDAELVRLEGFVAAANNEQAKTIENCNELEQKLKAENATLKEQHLATVRQLEARQAHEVQLSAELEASRAEQAQKTEALTMLTEVKNNATADVERLREVNDALQRKMDRMIEAQQKQLDETQSTLAARYIEVGENANAACKMAFCDQMKIENEYLNTHIKQLEAELAQSKETMRASDNDTTELRDKLKSLQYELYVLQKDAEQHAAQLLDKESQFEATKSEVMQLNRTLDGQQAELKRQVEHADFITQQNDTIQKQLLQTQQQLADTKQEVAKATAENLAHTETVTAASQTLEHTNESLRAEGTRQSETIETLNKQVGQLQAELHVKSEQLVAMQIELAERVQSTQKTQVQQQQHEQQQQQQTNTDATQLRSINEQLQRELEAHRYKSNAEQRNLQQEIEELQINNKQMAERITELEILRAGMQAQKMLLRKDALDAELATDAAASPDVVEKAELEGKLKAIMGEVQDVNNRNLFLEQKCENYLILEQSNERLKLQNAKLSRQLDETLVSLQHSDCGSPNTEFEYLKNIMFQYLTGNTNNETLVKVISAVLKFSPQQAQVALEKEHQRRSLLNKII